MVKFLSLFLVVLLFVNLTAAIPTTQPGIRNVIFEKHLENNRKLEVVESKPVAGKVTMPKIDFLKSEGGIEDVIEISWKLYLISNEVETELWTYKRISSAGRLATELKLAAKRFQILDARYFEDKSFCILFISGDNIYVGVSSADKSFYSPDISILRNDPDNKIYVEKGHFVGNLKEKTLEIHLENNMKSGALFKYKIAAGFTATQTQ